jgi:hypothetical protein
MDPRMNGEEGAHLLGFVRRQVVEDDVNLAVPRLCGDEPFEKTNEVIARVAGGRFPEDLTAFHIECGVERERAMAVVFEPVPFRAPGRQRQDRIEPVERLNRRFLIQAKHRRMLRRVHIEANYVGGFRFEVGIGSLCVVRSIFSGWMN